uniref:Uncharacterized protein n=1 Tax=Cacopsylla melanoneura TaxID=428564 RepID=A0A8D8M0K3_9HEMI
MIMMIEVAVVNPDVTGDEIRLTRNPKLRSPMISVTTPLRNVRRITWFGVRSWVNSYVSRAIKDVGPMDTSLMLPRSMYANAPMNAELRPKVSGSPANEA